MCIILIISIKISHCSRAVQRGLSEGFLLCSTVLVSAKAGPRPRPTKQYTNDTTICRLIWELTVGWLRWNDNHCENKTHLSWIVNLSTCPRVSSLVWHVCPVTFLPKMYYVHCVSVSQCVVHSASHHCTLHTVNSQGQRRQRNSRLLLCLSRVVSPEPNNKNLT